MCLKLPWQRTKSQPAAGPKTPTWTARAGTVTGSTTQTTTAIAIDPEEEDRLAGPTTQTTTAIAIDPEEEDRPPTSLTDTPTAAPSASPSGTPVDWRYLVTGILY